jgi:hypothetical protein
MRQERSVAHSPQLHETSELTSILDVKSADYTGRTGGLSALYLRGIVRLEAIL